MRKCIGSAKFGIEAHEAPPEDFPVQPSQRDGLGRMCKPHWTAYTRALRQAAPASNAAGTKLAVGTGTPPVVHGVGSSSRQRIGGPPKPEPIRTRVRAAKAKAEVDALAREAANVEEATTA